MCKPDAQIHHNTNPDYLRQLLEATGLSQRAVARRIGVSDRVLRYYLSDPDSDTWRPMPYPEQYAIEALAPPHRIPRSPK
jgi:transcriptional regulator with XRE-family HTH domain